MCVCVCVCVGSKMHFADFSLIQFFVLFPPRWPSPRGTPAACWSGGPAALGGASLGIPGRAHADRGPLVRRAPGPHHVLRGGPVSAVFPGPHRGPLKGLRRPLQLPSLSLFRSQISLQPRGEGDHKRGHTYGV